MKLRVLNWKGLNLKNWIKLWPDLKGVISNLAKVLCIFSCLMANADQRNHFCSWKRNLIEEKMWESKYFSKCCIFYKLQQINSTPHMFSSSFSRLQPNIGK